MRECPDLNILLFRLVVDLASNELGAAEVEQCEDYVIPRCQSARHVDHDFASRPWQSGEFSNRNLHCEAVIEATKLEPTLGEQMRSAGVVKADRDLMLCRRWRAHVFHRYVLDCTLSSETRRRDIHLHAGAENVLERIALDRRRLRELFDEEDVRAFLAQGCRVLDAKSDDTRGMRIDPDREGRGAQYRAARRASGASGEKAIVAIFCPVPILTGNRRLHRRIGGIREREAPEHAGRARGDHAYFERIYEQLRACRL